MRRRSLVATSARGKVLYLSGTPYQQGRQPGQDAAELIHESSVAQLCATLGPPCESIQAIGIPHQEAP